MTKVENTDVHVSFPWVWEAALNQGRGLFQRGEQHCVARNNLSVMRLINPVPKHPVIKKKISICGRKWVLVNLYGWRG